MVSAACGRWAGSRTAVAPDHGDDSGQGRLEQRRIVFVGASRDQVRRDPSVATERFMLYLPRSTGELPATSPPHGDLVMRPSTASSSRSSPMIRSY
jgi:hypothetical protein